ncbi:type 2 lanthipeptide synthetase LanM family protein [Effusibacillus consociatus]|uniref:Type 2 lanthipeptide synthetase LanM family protein n=1 Tax=Effusibacillus consociatus TaxID=1117041 RepID=A0ABV9Q622_9BACL
MKNTISLLYSEIWFKGAYINERKVDLGISEGKGEAKVDAWCKRTGLYPTLVKYRLEEEGLDIKSFSRILAQSDRPVLFKEPDWLVSLHDIFKSDDYTTLSDEDIDPKAQSEAPFFKFVVPFLKWSKGKILHQLKEWQEKFPEIPFSNSMIISSILKPVYQNLLTIVCRTLMLELNIARVEGQLIGNTSEARFEDFVSRKLTDKVDILAILHKYPVLARLMTVSAKNIIYANLEAVEHFLLDREQIEELIEGDFSKLIEIKSGVGDVHNSGKSVLIFQFASGSRLLYKPRSLGVDAHFQELLSWINEKGLTPSFKLMQVIDRGSYGWEEFISVEECIEKDQVKRFYQRLGGYLALLYLLNATDFHSENIIASGEYPYLVDLESLFQNFMPVDVKQTALQKASDELMNSVLRTGLLPVSLFKSGAFQAIEISGIGGYGGQRLPKLVYGFENIRTDEMKMVKKQGFLKESDNRPYLKGKPIQAEDYIEDVTTGFYNVYQVLLKNREELQSEDGPIFKFANDPVRSILRNTQSYVSMLEAGLHPDNLVDGLARVQLFDFMWRIVDHLPAMVRIVASENADLLEGDVPAFSTRVNSKDLWDSRGKRITNFYNNESLSYVLQRLAHLSEEDCIKQMKYIRISMTTMIKKWDIKLSPRDPHQKLVTQIATREEFLKAAIDIGERLEKSAIWGADGKDVTWIGLGANEHDQWLFTPLDVSLYDGVLGVALFLGYLAKETGIEKFDDLARKAFNTGRMFLEQPGAIKTLSAFYGHASVVYVLSHLSVLWNEPQLLEEALIHLAKSEPLIEKDVMYDLLAGCAGTLVVALPD